MSDKKLWNEFVALEKERDAMRAELDALLAWKEEAERQEPVGVLHVGSWYGEELQDWEFEADQTACDRLNEAHQHKEASLSLYARPIPAQSVRDEFREGAEAAARLIDQKAELYATRFGHDNTGGISFGQGPHAKSKMDHYTGLLELADELRAALAAAPKPEVK